MKNFLLAIVFVALLPMTAQAASLDGLTFATSYFNQPVSNTGGASLSVRLPFGTLPSPWEHVMGWSLIPQPLQNRLYYSVGGSLTAQGPGPQPTGTLLMVGLGYKLHDLLGVSAGLSRHEFKGDVTNVTFWSVDVDVRAIATVIERIAGS